MIFVLLIDISVLVGRYLEIILFVYNTFPQEMSKVK